MHHAALVTSHSLSLAAPDVAESAAQVDDSAPIPTTPDDLLVSLQVPVPLENVRARVDVRDGVNLEISYDLPDVGRVSVALHAQDDGSGRGLVRVGDAVVAEVAVVGGIVASEAADLSDLRPAQAHAVAASVLQVWHEPAVTEALDDRDLKCTVAGGIAGATAGVLVTSVCGIFFKRPKCVGAGYGAYYKAWDYITDKCNGAQNN